MGMSITKYFTFATLVIFVFMTNVGLWSDHSNWLTHELEHSVNLTPMTVAANYLALHDVEFEDITSERNGLAVEHELLHAADHLQLFLSVNVITVFLSLPRIFETHFNSLAISMSASDTPFRPPRIFSLATQ